MNTFTGRRQLKSLLDKVGLLELFSAGIAAAVIELAIDGILIKAIATIGISLLVGCAAVVTQTNWLNDAKLNRFLSKNGVIPLIGLGVVASLCLYFLFAPETANAQFFFAAEAKIIEGLGQFSADGAAENVGFLTNIIYMVMWLLRFIMIIYLGVQLVKIVGQMREEEDWKATAKTPVMFLIVITVGDQVSKMILGV